MKNFIKSPADLKKLPMQTLHICMKTVIASYILLLIHYSMLSDTVGNSVVETRYLADSSEYIVVSAVMSLVFGVLFDLFVQKELKQN